MELNIFFFFIILGLTAVCLILTVELDNEKKARQPLIYSFELKEKGDKMVIRDFAVEVTKLEGKKKQVNIAQVLEVLKMANKVLGGKLYALIREQKG